MVPGTHPTMVKSSTIIIEPQPLSYTASGGRKMERRIRQILIMPSFFVLKIGRKNKSKVTGLPSKGIIFLRPLFSGKLEYAG
jgi:hypothetical protein